MTLGSALSVYIALNAALVVGVTSLAVIELLARRVSAARLLSMNYWAAAGIAASSWARLTRP